MAKVSFLHCADLHLGCTPNHLEIRYQDFFASFKDLIDKAINNECKYIIISGDLFHLKVINSKTLLNVLELLEYALQNNIKIIVIEGNHDKAFFVDENSWLYFLKKKGYITLLTHKIIGGQLVLDEESIYEDEDIRIIGIGYLGAATALYLKNIENKISKSNKFTVLMLHAAINRLCGEEMGHLQYKALAPLKGIVDYVALGHIHTKYEYEDFIYNPGSIESIRTKDAKKKELKGFYIVNVEGKQKEVKYFNSKQRNIQNRIIKLDPNLSKEDIEFLIKNKEFKLEPQSVLEITIYGKVSFNPYLIDFEEIKNTLKEKYNLLYVEINNLINIVTNENILNNIIDINNLEDEAIRKYLSINCPEVSDTNYLIKEIQKVKNSLIEKQEYDTIINNMIEKGEVL